MKKFASLVLSLFLALSCVACAADPPPTAQDPLPSEPSEPAEPSKPSEPSEPEPEPVEPSEPSKPSEPEQEKIVYKEVSQKIERCSGAEIFVKARANAAIKLEIHYFDADKGLWLRGELEGESDATGALALSFPLPEGATEIRVRIVTCLVFDKAAQERVKAEAEIEKIEFSEPAEKQPLLTPPVREIHSTMPSVGEVRSLAVFIEFPDRKFVDPLPKERLQAELFGEGEPSLFPYESLSAWFDRASYGNLSLSGDVLFYECKAPVSSYLGENHEKLLMEVLRGLDDQIDLSDYDSDKNGAPDQLAFVIPVYGDAELSAFWYSATYTWYENLSFRIDGEQIEQYVALDAAPSEADLTYLKSSLIHEIGHCMGLPDYYKYNGAEDWEGFHGGAGYACLDDALGDFCGFSKLMYGWFREGEALFYSGAGEETFSLYSLSERASCLILPIDEPFSFFSEYFVVEFITPTENNSILGSYAAGAGGVRIFHVQAETAIMDWGTKELKYNNYSRYYLGDDKIRVLRLVNDGHGFYQKGDVCTFGTENFAAYDKNGDQTIDTGYTVRIGAAEGKTQTVTVTRKI